MKIKSVRMVIMPNQGPISTSEISEAEACAIRNNAITRHGRVSIAKINEGFKIVDDSGITLLTAIFE